ncbi:MAG TPA: MBL fold metallo-hydrolase [Thermoanaerobaculia bacterium]|nr:MBL fold metallo-hydrolase [Thermoanaerobaculia bacterium]
MKLTVFPSDHGDCLLLESNKKRMLIDGGLAASFNESVLPRLSGTHLDCVYLSHIDEDHIQGLLALVDATFEWRVYAYRKEQDPDAQPPESPEPPTIAKVWHNSFSDWLPDNASEIAASIAQTASILQQADANDVRVHRVAAYHRNLAASVRQSINLRFRLSPDQLDIAVNPEHQGDLMYVREPGASVPLFLGKAKITLIGPSRDDLEKQRVAWNAWLRSSKATVSRVRRQAKEDAKDVENTAQEVIVHTTRAANDLANRILIPDLDISALDPKKARRLGNRHEVTVPNLASLMLLVEEKGKSVLLTGDGHADDILRGLETAGKLDADGNLHVNVLKVQHHGSEHNMTTDFARRITADHYVFCGNGFASNPETVVIEAIAHSRFGAPEERATNMAADGDFTFWFNSTPDTSHYKKHMKIVESLLADLVADSNRRMSYKMDGEHFEVPL